MRVAETIAAQAFYAFYAIVDMVFSRIVRIAVKIHCGIADRCASRALTSARQHFLKLDAVFSNVLVYSGCVCISIPECTQRLSQLTTFGGHYG